ncbi:hypothetical protein N7462_005552 [Penicillium macrosclerotiorum]|uniref:uncharacterized protein n=1 Tax=Penicillium macrosclerotiorum TaxID=303699 RepID=UPI00254693A2|nr:uncharacterized protein N7462_005552 [Penicillium macrosclerotiorum]KAJ5682387.1 hypothetical protein N7462_005552 [Penicillium macrosclerotiorum]
MAEEQDGPGKPYLQDSSVSENVSTSSLGVQETHILQERRIGVFGAISLIVNKIIGSGIFSTPTTIFKLSGSPGMALMLWVIAGLISTCGAMVLLEFGTSIPRSGGMKTSASNAITASSYLLKAAAVESTTWKLRGLAIAAVSFAVGVHSVAPRLGRGLQDVMSAVKLFTLLFIVCTGFAALGGHVQVKANNFDPSNSFKGTSNNGYNIGTALLDAIFSFQGYDNLNAVLSEVKNPQRTLRIALPTAMGMVTLLYILANVAYFAGVPREEFLSSDLTIAASLFNNVFGHSAAVKALPALVAISAIGHLLSVAFTELAKDGVTPFPNILMQNRPFKTPLVCLAVHLGVTIAFICAPPAGDAFDFVVGLGTYPSVFLLTLVTIGLIKLRIKNENFQSSFTVPWAVLAFYLAGNIFLLVMPFVPPVNGQGSTSLPYYLSPVVALAILALGVIYYVGRFVLLPWIFKYELDLVEVGLSDGSRVSRYKARKSP